MIKAQAARRRVQRHHAQTYAGVAAAAVLAAACLTPATASDVELGRYLSSECVTCHGQARSNGAIPDIYGMPESTFVDVVKAYREKRLANQVMQTIATRLSDEEIAALAAYFATARKPQ
jgi:cytochrome c553